MSTAVQPETTVLAPNTGKTVPDRDAWAVKPLTNAKAAHAFPDNWGAAALHHKISKEKLSSIAEQVALLYNSPTPKLKDAVRAFWTQCWALAGAQVTAAVTDAAPKVSPYRLLWNLPVNVSIGPPSPATDPGMAFDPDTEPVPDTPGRRRMDAVSTALSELEEAWDAASSRDNGRGDFQDPALWKTLTDQLGKAHAAADAAGRGTKLLYPPKREQWLYDTVTSQHLRKGMTDYVGAVAGRQLFQQARLNAPAIAVHKDSPNRLVTGRATLRHQGEDLTLEVRITEGVIHHVCERHTLTFFDFKGTARPINTLWPGVGTFQAATALATRLAPHIARCTLVQLIERGDPDRTQWVGEDVKLTQQSAGPDTVYFDVSIEKLRDAQGANPAEVIATVKTFAPSGDSGPGFLRQDLVTIGTALGLLP
ncbi:hypothetical protein ACIRBX_26425 [Kitasatospora sp. NPDC096147]|uniref:hypothetical protein n=1 Tax=Kitasatospora sp. NPDC096147 TaxID=3364093 RepID=UPI0038006595